MKKTQMINYLKRLIFILLLCSGCDKIEDLLTFEVRDTTTFTIPSITGINSPIEIPVPPIESSSSEDFENNNTEAALVKDVILKELSLEIIDPEDKGFGFIKSIEIYISTKDEAEVMLASKYNIPVDQGNTLVLDPSGAKLDPYLKSDLYNLRTSVQVKEIPGRDITVEAGMTFRVTADPL